MIIDLTKILKESDSEINASCTSELKTIDNGASSYPVSIPESFDIHIDNEAGKRLNISLDTAVTVTGQCDRCLASVEKKVDISVREEYRIEGESIRFDSEDDEIIFIEESALDVDKLLREYILLSWPTKFLCRDDCKGLCSMCGQNLNEGDCGCDRHVPDPRSQMFRDLLENFKEV